MNARIFAHDDNEKIFPNFSFFSLTRGGKPGRPKWYMEGFRRSRRASPAAPLKKRKDTGKKWKMRTTGKIKGFFGWSSVCGMCPHVYVS